MCNFFSCNSDGQGNVIYFKVEDIAKIMSEGNKDGLDFNSHTSIASYFNHPPVYEDKWNKWEYDVEKKVLKVDSLVVKDDRRRVKKIIENYLKDKDMVFIRNLYGRNSGDYNSGNYNSGYRNSGDRNSGEWNSGYRNSGDSNSGYRNSGDWNSGDRNSGDRNSGDRNSGDRNSGDSNSGDRNSGDWNSGDRNSGDSNSGDWNSGDRNSGDSNSGDSNSGNRNSGNWNSGDGVLNSFCSERQYYLFNKPCSQKEYEKIDELGLYKYLNVCDWVWKEDMTAMEKKSNPTYETCGGYLKHTSLEDCWKKVPKKVLKEIKKLANFDAKVFKEVCGLDI